MRRLPIAPEIVEDLDNEVGELRQQVIRLEGEKAELQLCYDSAYARAERLEAELAAVRAVLDVPL